MISVAWRPTTIVRVANIAGQLLGTDESCGYVIMDLNKEVSAEVVDRLRQMDFNIKTRVLW